MNNKNWKSNKLYKRKHDTFKNKGFYSKKNICVEKLSENQVAITEYVSSLDGFSGIIKARYSDFHVNEIDLNGRVTKITNTEIPESFRKQKAATTVPQESPNEHISEELWKEITELMSKMCDGTIKLDVTDLDKGKRSKIHKDVKLIFGSQIVSSTIEIDNKKFIELKHYKKGDPQNVREQWPENIAHYVHFLMYTENCDTMEAINKISHCLHKKASAFNYCGTKDRRSKSTQWVCVYKVEPWKLVYKLKQFRSSIRIGNFEFKDNPLSLGELRGNRFRIALRNVTSDRSIVDNALESLRSNGFINYYGLQRFGYDKDTPTYAIGLKLLQGKYKDACSMILKVRDQEDPVLDVVQAKKIYHETGDAKGAAAKIKDSSSIEAKLLQSLAKHGKSDYVNGLEGIPRNMRLMYIHSFQSLIWNKAVSRRIKDYGLKPIIGDLVLINEQDELSLDAEITFSNDKRICDIHTNGNNIEESQKSSETKDIKSPGIEDLKFLNAKETESKKHLVKILTENDLEKYTIFDIVLPLPGYDVTYPENALKDYYKQLLEESDLELEMHKKKVKTYNLNGHYRKVMIKPDEMSWYYLKYNDPNDTLIRSDFEEHLGHKQPEDVADGKYLSVIIIFNLKPSSYATMALREALKEDTSSSYQSKLNSYHTKHENSVSNNQVNMSTNLITDQSLLNNKDKFDAFRKVIFMQDSEQQGENLKRGLEDTQDTTEAIYKKTKLEQI